MRTQIKITVKGIVQGVFFRSNTKKQANILNIKGYVKNTPEGSVEIIADGDNNNINQFIEWCREGPSTAQVESIEIEEIKNKNTYDDFTIKY